MLRPTMKGGIGGITLFLLLFPISPALHAQVGQITGTVTNADTGEPLSAVQITVEGTGLGAVSGAEGSFTLEQVPVGTRTVVAQRLGYQSARQTQVTVAAGESTTVDLTLSPTVLALQEIVATGLVDPVEGVRSPISVGRVSRDQMPVVSTGSAVQNLAGRVPGVRVHRRSGQPGSGDSFMLRSPTSVTLSGAPMIVVDGVILGQGGDPRTSHMGPSGSGAEGRSVSTVNIESMDIESIEVIRGAAAASLYGSRAASGVISITTARGQGLEVGETQFSARSEIGFSVPFRADDWNTNHAFLVDDPANPTTYVDLAGNPVPRANRVLQGIAVNPAAATSWSFWDTPHPGPTFDHLRELTRPSNVNTQNFSVWQNAGSTNFALSVSRHHEDATLIGNDGYTRNSFRLNADHRARDNLSFRVSTYHSRDHQDQLDIGFGTILGLPVDVNFRERDEDGNYIRQPDPEVGTVNPIWSQQNQESDRWRVRSLGSLSGQWQPAYWISLQGSVSYDRQDRRSRSYTPKGVLLTASPSDGSLSMRSDENETWNAEADLTLRRDFGALNVRTTLRSLLERDSFERQDATGSNFLVEGVPRINVARDRSSSSYSQEIRSLGYLWDTAFDYDAKYIVTLLLRRDGSSLFGPDNRWHNYYRAAAAWRIGEEDWFNIPNVDEFKIRYARGTAGGRPQFEHQYETWNVTAAGLSKGFLGNTELRPEHTLEQEVALETILYGRVGIDLTVAWQETSEQLTMADLPMFTGFSNQWQNGGTIEGQTVELGVEAQVLNRPGFTWSTRFSGDKSWGKITEWPFARQNPAWRTWDVGLDLYDTWGFAFLGSHDDLTTHDGGAALGASDQFQVNDDGHLVWVGNANYWEGIEQGLWGTTGVVGGRTYEWGMPIRLLDEFGGSVRTPIGNTRALNLGWSNNFRWGQLSAHAHWHAALGFDAVNFTWQVRSGVLGGQAPEHDQSSKPDELKKPMRYYQLLAADFGGSSHYTEPGDFLKLRSIGLNYRLSTEQLNRFGLGTLGLSSMTLGLVGRDLLTITSYSGPDPEVAIDLNLRNNFDLNTYPPAGSFTAEVQVTF